MNIHTFKDAASSKRSALSNELDDDDDDHDVAPLRREVEGEEESTEQFNDMGEAIEPFNLKNEREGGGHFDENMNYVFQKEHQEVDAWVAEMDEVSMEKAIGEAAHAMKKRLAKQEQEEINELHRVKKSSLQLRKELLTLLQPGETLARAMRRLGGKDEKQANPIKRRMMHKVDNSMDTDDTPQLTAEQKKEQLRLSRAAIHKITEIADELMSSGSTNVGSGAPLTGIYDMTYESILASTLLWEYKGMDEVVYGPYTAQQISQWKAQGFLTGPTAVLIRSCGEVQQSGTVTQPAGDTARTGGQKAKFDVFSFSGSNSGGSGGGGGIYDDDEVGAGEEPAGKRSKVGFSNDTVSRNTDTESAYVGNTQHNATSFVKGPWMHSDELDFGGFVDLDVEERKQKESEQAATAAKAELQNDSSTARIVASVNTSNRAYDRRTALQQQMEEDDEDDVDNDELLARRNRKSKGRGKMNTEEDLDEDDEDDD